MHGGDKVLAPSNHLIVVSQIKPIHETPEAARVELGVRCRDIVAAASGGAWVIDVDANTAMVNPKMADMLGARPEQMLGRPFTDFMSVAQRDRALVYLAKRQRGVAEQHDFEFEHRDGRAVWLSLATFPIFDAPGQYVGALALASDITAQRLAQEELNRARQLSQGTLDALTAHICVLDASGRIIAINHAWSAYASANGAAEGAVGTGVNYLEVCAGAQGAHSGEAPEFARRLKDVLEGRSPTFEMQYPCHSATESRWFMVNVSPLSGCDPARAVVAHQDVTTRMLSELRLREAQRLESLGTLAGGIAHDFNNMLAAALGSASLALDHLGAEHPAREHVEQIALAGQRARQLVQQILAFGGRQARVAEPVALHALAQESMALLRRTLPAGVEIETRFCNEPITLLADATQIQQVLMNLGTNAWHALRGGAGRITLTLARRDFATAEVAQASHAPGPGAWAVFLVADDGVGMDEAVRERIFEPFFTTRPVGMGSGLGLSIVHGIVTEHGGSVRVDSAPGRGSVFHVYLPALDGTVPTPVVAVPAKGPDKAAGLRIVCIDDDPVVGTVLQALLEREGCRARYFSDPAEALAAVRLEPQAVDLVLTDQNMANMSGLQVAAELACIRPELPVILITGLLADDVVEGAAALGVREVLRKETAFEELPAAVIRAALGVR